MIADGKDEEICFAKKKHSKNITYLLLSLPFLLLKNTQNRTGGNYKLDRKMFTVKSKYFILKFHLSLKLATLFCTVLINHKGIITAVLFGYSTDSFSYKL